MSESDTPRMTGDERCWRCTLVNSAIGIILAAVPFAAAIVRGDSMLIAGSALWAVAVLGYTGYRLLARGYLPYAGTVARRSGLHDRLGPGRKN